MLLHMDEIKVMLKPDWVSWDDIHELLLVAHKKNRENGLVMSIPHLPSSELENRIGENGRCFVAMEGEKLVGTTSVRFYKGKSWFDKDKYVAHCMLTAILPNYQGIGIIEELYELRNTYIHDMKAEMMHGDTAENNVIALKNAQNNGFVNVAYVVHRTHNSVVFVKWLGECPFTEKKIKRKYKLSKAIAKMQYKSGGIERSKLISFLCIVIKKIAL